MRVFQWRVGAVVAAFGVAASAQIGVFQSSGAVNITRPSDNVGWLGGTYTGLGAAYGRRGRSLAPRGVARTVGGGVAYHKYARSAASPLAGSGSGAMSQGFRYAPLPAGSGGGKRYAYSAPRGRYGSSMSMSPAAGLGALGTGPLAGNVPPGLDGTGLAVSLTGPTPGERADAQVTAMRRDYITQAIRAFRAGDYKEACARFRIVDTIDIDRGLGQLGVVHSLFAGGRYNSALVAFGTLLTSGADLLGDFASQLYGDSATLAKHVAAFEPQMTSDSPAVQALGAYMLWAVGSKDRALAAARRAVQLAPDRMEFKRLAQSMQAAMQPPL